jgi:hypothetical protein
MLRADFRQLRRLISASGNDTSILCSMLKARLEGYSKQSADLKFNY